MANIVVNLPALPSNASPELVQWADQLRAAVETILNELVQPAQRYVVSNVTSSRTLDPTTATLSQVAQVVGTLISDLQIKGTLAR